MTMRPQDWSVVVVGRWNRAILTPAGIAKHLFRLPESTPVDVLLPVDVVAPPLVKFDGLSVVANDDRLAIQPDNCVYDRLDRSREIARNALEFLPKTPVTAVGVNVKFVTDSPPSQLLDICVNPLDTALSDGDFQISQRSWGWSLPLEDSRINLTLVATSDNSYEMHFNFHYATNDVDSQLKWLTQPIGNLRDNVRKITETCMNLEPTEVPDGQ